MNRPTQPVVSHVAAPAAPPANATQLLVARLAIEEALQFEGIATAVSGHQILLQGPRAFSLIEVFPASAGRVRVRIRSYLGEVLLKDEARDYLESLRLQAVPADIQLSADGVVLLSWEREFGAVVEPAVVVAVLQKMVALMARMHTPLWEEFYLRPVDPRRIRDTSGDAA
jgi:hypothetical protein